MMFKQLKESLQRLDGFNVRGYRSPALSLSEELFEVLSEIGIRYDSTLQIASPFYHSVRLPYPVFLEEYGFWEMPLMVQDDNYVRDTDSSPDEILTSLKRFVDETIQLNGVFVFNVHPHNLVGKDDLYREILKFLKSVDGVAIRTMGEVLDYAQNYPDHK